MELTRYGVSRVVLPGTGSLPGYHAMRWSSVTLSAILGKVVCRSLQTTPLRQLGVRHCNLKREYWENLGCLLVTLVRVLVASACLPQCLPSHTGLRSRPGHVSLWT